MFETVPERSLLQAKRLYPLKHWRIPFAGSFPGTEEMVFDMTSANYEWNERFARSSEAS